jgi:UDP-N-acetylglucosamine 1-carboxyvinyltransferase
MNYRIQGRRPIIGEVTVNTSKNAAMGLLCAAILNKGKTTIKHCPRIEEVNRILEVLVSMGFAASWLGKDLELVPPPSFDLTNLDRAAAEKTRSVGMMIGALAHHLPTFSLPCPGGCKLGDRSFSAHVHALQKLGIEIEQRDGVCEFEVNAVQKHAAEVVMTEMSDTATINALLVAAMIPGETILKFCSANYQVQDVCFFLQTLGVAIDGIGTTTLVIHGVEEIRQDAIAIPSEDPIEAMFFLSLAATCKGALTIRRAPIDFLEIELLKLEEMGLKVSRGQKYVGENKSVVLVDLIVEPSDLVAPVEKIAAQPYPGLNIDNLPFFVPPATQAKGRTLIHDWVYESRAFYYAELNRLGADVVLADPHRAYVTGPTSLSAADITCPPALRPATIILIGMLAAEGESILRNVYPINRGYEALHERLKLVGAEIEAFE